MRHRRYVAPARGHRRDPHGARAHVHRQGPRRAVRGPGRRRAAVHRRLRVEARGLGGRRRRAAARRVGGRGQVGATGGQGQRPGQPARAPGRVDRERAARDQAHRGRPGADPDVVHRVPEPQPLRRDALAELGRQRRSQADAVLAQPQPRQPVREHLEEAALTGQEVLGGEARQRVLRPRLLTARLGEQVVRAPHERAYRALEIRVRRAARLPGLRRVDRVHRVRHRRAVRVGAGRVVVEGGRRGAGLHGPLQRVGQEHRVRLLDRGAVVPGVLEVDLPLGVVRDAQTVRDPVPGGRRAVAEQAGGAGRVAERGGGDRVGEDAVVHAVAVLVGPGHVPDGVGAVGIGRGAGAPEVRDALQQRPAPLPQPVAVAGGQKVLPDGQRDVSLEVVLRQTVRRVPALALGVEAAPARTGPRVEQPVVPELLGVRAGRAPGAVAVLDDRTGQLRAGRQQPREHPRLRVPEDHSRVVVAGQTGRGDAVGGAAPGARQ